MKKISVSIMFLLIVMLSVSMSAAEPEKVTLTLWDFFFAQSDYFNQEIKLFQEKYPWIEIKRTKQVNHKYNNIIELAARSKNLPDLYWPRSGVMGSSLMTDVEQGWIIPLDKWATPEWKAKRFPKGVFSAGNQIINGKTYTLPFTGDEVWHQLYINRKVFREAGLVDKKGNILHPRTWDEYRKFARIITQKGKGKVWGVGIASKPHHLFAHAYYEWARWDGALGGDHVEKFELDYRVGRYTFDHPAYVKVFKLLLGLIKDGSVIPSFLSIDDETLKVKFADGEIGMILGGIWNQTGWMTTHPGWYDYDCIAEPPPDEKGYRGMQVVISNSKSYVISSNCKHPEEAWLFLDWLTSPEAGARWVKSGNGISIHPSANTRENVKTEQTAQYLEVCKKLLRFGPDPTSRNPNLALIKLEAPTPSKEEVFWGILSGMIKEKDIPKALKDMNDRYNAELEKQIKRLKEKGYKVDMKDLIFPDWNPFENYGE